MTKQISAPIQQIPETLPRPQVKNEPEMRADVIVIGAGPTGLACAIEAHRAGFKTIAIDKGCLVNSHLQLSREHDVFHHAGVAGNRRHSVQHLPAEAEPRRSARILPEGHGALSSRRPPISVGKDGNWARTATSRSPRLTLWDGSTTTGPAN